MPEAARFSWSMTLVQVVPCEGTGNGAVTRWRGWMSVRYGWKTNALGEAVCWPGHSCVGNGSLFACLGTFDLEEAKLPAKVREVGFASSEGNAGRQHTQRRAVAGKASPVLRAPWVSKRDGWRFPRVPESFRLTSLLSTGGDGRTGLTARKSATGEGRPVSLDCLPTPPGHDRNVRDCPANRVQRFRR